MTVCATPECPALALPGGSLCPVCAKGLRKYRHDDARLCASCGKRLKTGTWITVREGKSYHFPACKKKAA